MENYAIEASKPLPQIFPTERSLETISAYTESTVPVLF
jgi:hypothetical protein